jgi:hypothetical protein
MIPTAVLPSMCCRSAGRSSLADLMNVAIEELVRNRFELPGWDWH